jgi:hypothetical protein
LHRFARSPLRLLGHLQPFGARHANGFAGEPRSSLCLAPADHLFAFFVLDFLAVVDGGIELIECDFLGCGNNLGGLLGALAQAPNNMMLARRQ